MSFNTINSPLMEYNICDTKYTIWNILIGVLILYIVLYTNIIDKTVKKIKTLVCSSEGMESNTMIPVTFSEARKRIQDSMNKYNINSQGFDTRKSGFTDKVKSIRFLN